MTLFDKMTKENQDAVEHGHFTPSDSCFRDEALKALKEKSYFSDLTFSEVVAIVHFTHPTYSPNLNEVIDLFKNGN